MKNIFKKKVSEEIITRISKLNSNTKPVWGKMNVAQMLAHLNVQYEVIYENEKFPKPNAFTRFMLKAFVKNKVVGPKPFSRNGRTAPYFVMDTDKNFETEKERLINYIYKTQKNGVEVFVTKRYKIVW